MLPTIRRWASQSLGKTRRMVVHRNLSATLIEELYTFTDAMSRCPRCAEAEAPTFRPGLRVRLRCKGANQNNAPGTKNEWHSIAPCPCPLWVKSRHVQCKTACPLYSRKRHQMRQMGMSAKGQ